MHGGGANGAWHAMALMKMVGVQWYKGRVRVRGGMVDCEGSMWIQIWPNFTVRIVIAALWNLCTQCV